MKIVNNREEKKNTIINTSESADVQEIGTHIEASHFACVHCDCAQLHANYPATVFKLQKARHSLEPQD